MTAKKRTHQKRLPIDKGKLDTVKLVHIVKLLQKNIVNEYIPLKTILLVTIGGRKCLNCNPLSKNLMINDRGGLGKDFLSSTVMNYTDSANWYLKKTPTPAAITLEQRPDKDGNIKRFDIVNTLKLANFLNILARCSFLSVFSAL